VSLKSVHLVFVLTALVFCAGAAAQAMAALYEGAGAREGLLALGAALLGLMLVYHGVRFWRGAREESWW